MLAKVFKKKLGISPLLAAANLVLVASSFAWYYLAFAVLQNLMDILKTTTSETLAVMGINVGAIAVTAVIGSFMGERTQKRESILLAWMFGGIFVSLIPFLFVPSTFGELAIISIIFGAYFGLGMPPTMGYFAASTTPENRARLGGIAYLAIALSIFLLGSLAGENVASSGIVLATIRLTGLLLFNWTRRRNTPLQHAGRSSYFRIITSKSVLLFLIPWLVFNLVDYMTIPAVELTQGTEYLRSVTLYEAVFIAIFSLVAGFLADSLGRKRLAILGFALLGGGYAAVSFSPSTYGWYVYTVADGFAWGIFNVLFLFTVWGDLAQEQHGEKLYVVGSLPFLFSNFMRLLFGPFVSSIAPVALFSLASFFLFIAVLPLVYAPETLPEKIMKDRDLKSYVEKAMKKMQSETEKKRSDVREKSENCVEFTVKTEEETDEYEAAQKLAEKYY